MYKGFLFQSIDNGSLVKAKKQEINRIFVYTKDLNDENLKKIRDVLGNVEINAVLKCFEGKELQQKFPDAMPLEMSGREVNDVDYYPVSPLNDDVKNYLIEEVRKAVKFPILNLWLDQFQFPTKWDVIEPEILDTDYSDVALKKFEEYIGEPIEGANLEEKYLHIDGSYYHEWLQFKASALNDFLQRVKDTVSEDHKQIAVGIFAVPWEEGDYSAGIKRIIAQHFDVLTGVADKLAIQLPYKAMHKDTDWIKSKIAYFWQLGKPFVCIIEDSGNLQEAIEAGSISPSEGVVIKETE